MEYVEILSMILNSDDKITKEYYSAIKGINTQFFLVGSGARNMVTQNGDGPIDFDYNLNILSCDDINN